MNLARHHLGRFISQGDRPWDVFVTRVVGGWAFQSIAADRRYGAQETFRDTVPQEKLAARANGMSLVGQAISAGLRSGYFTSAAPSHLHYLGKFASMHFWIEPEGQLFRIDWRRSRTNDEYSALYSVAELNHIATKTRGPLQQALQAAIEKGIINMSKVRFFLPERAAYHSNVKNAFAKAFSQQIKPFRTELEVICRADQFAQFSILAAPFVTISDIKPQWIGEGANDNLVKLQDVS